MSPSIVASVLFWLLVNTNLGDTLIDDRIKASDQLNFYTFEADQLVRVKRNVINGTSLANKTNSEIVFNESLVKFVNLNDSHEQLTVHWAGMNWPVIICLAKNRKNSSRNQSSAVYISHNYGQTFEKISVFKLKNSEQATISTFYISPVLNSYYMFVDSTHSCIFITKDFGKNFQRIDLHFTPKSFQMHHSSPNLIIASSVEQFQSSSLYMSENFGLSWRQIEEKIGYFSWSVKGVDLNERTIFIQRNQPSGLSAILSSSEFFQNKKSMKVWLAYVEKMKVIGRFIFATRRIRPFGVRTYSYQLWISVDRKLFYRAIIPLSEEPINFHIADVSPDIIFLCVTYNDSTTHLYTSDANFETFTLSMENIVFYNPTISKNIPGMNGSQVIDREFADLTPVSGIRGTYIVSKWKNSTRKSASEIITLMTFDMGNKWHKLKPPTVDSFGHPVVCNTSLNCSLHLVQRYLAANSNTKSVLTRTSSVGFIMAAGVVGSSVKGKPSIYLSVDAGNTWRQILTGNYLFAFGDFGAIIVAVAHYSRGAATNELYYSIDDGESFSWLQFSREKINVYGLLTEPGERNAVFTIFGSREKTHDWIIIQVNCTSLFKFQCKTPHNYKEWSPHDFESDCLLGSTQLFKRRIASYKCFNGEDFVRATALINCPCKHTDYECDIGYVHDKTGGAKCVLSKELAGLHDPLFVPNDCRPGKMFNKSRGYRKIIGNTCEGGEEEWYSPQLLPCPLGSIDLEFILFVQRHEISMIRLNTEKFEKETLVPKTFVSNAIVADLDIEKHCIYWSDISLNRILRFCINGQQFQPEVVIETNLNSVEGLAFNQINRHLYFVNGNYSKIELINVDVNHEGRMRRIILSKPNIEKPRGIALDPVNCYLFITDWSSTNPAIIRSDLDGENIMVLFNSNTVTWPNGIAIDHPAEKIYWVDAKHDYIASSDYDGKDFKFILHGDQVQHPFALGLFKDFIFYDDWNLQKLILIHKNNSTKQNVILNEVVGPMDLKIITPFFNKMTNICNRNNTCEHLCIAKPFNSYRCLCPDGFVITLTPDGNEKCSCPPGQELTKTGACRPLYANSTCSPNEFICDNGHCISRSWKCDDDDDCGDRSDEKFCNVERCKPNEFQCKSTGNCILDLWKCDFEKECDDGSDEDIEMCAPLYPKCNITGMFQCANHRCIDKNYVCDHIDHCRDGSDEVDCQNFHSTTANTTCTEYQFQCGNGDCIPQSRRCDVHYDCLDRSDEKDCDHHLYMCMSSEFLCPEFLCIDKVWLCDGENDCIDGSDEMNCTSTNNTAISVLTSDWPKPFSNGSCPMDWFTCKMGRCIPMNWHCDGNIDCPDRSDETDCGGLRNNDTAISTLENDTNSCGSNRFLCYKSGTCIFSSFVCDGDIDCLEGEDELNCNKKIPAQCNGSFECFFSTQCVPNKKLCDGIQDCSDGSDEWSCENKKEPVNSICLGFTCKFGECIKSHLRCDGFVNCFDGSDEEGCEDISYDVKDLLVKYQSIRYDSFTVSWKSPNSSLKFQYMPSYSQIGLQSIYNTSWIDEESYTFEGLDPGFAYRVSVYCKLIGENKVERVFEPRVFIIVSTESIAPKPPQNFTLESTDFNRVNLRWSQPVLTGQPIKAYKVYFSPPDPPLSQTFEYNENHVQLCCFQVGINYTFWATTMTRNLESIDSEKISTVIGPAATIKEFHQKNLTNSSVLLEWKADSDKVQKWLISYRCEDYFPSFSKNYTIDGNIALITDLSPGVNYQFKLYPYVNDTIWFDGIQDNMISIRTLGPQLPSIVVGSKVQGSVVALSWTAPAHYKNMTNIDWEYGVYVGYNARDMKMFARTRDTNIILKNLYSCELYLAQIRVIEPFGIGPAPNEYKIITKFDPTSPPKDLRVEAANYQKTKYRITWNLPCQEPVSQPVGFVVSVNDIVYGSKDRFRLLPNNDYYHTFELSVHYGATYELRVATDHSDARLSGKVIIKAPPMPKVPKPNAYMYDNGKIFVVWKTIDNYPKDYQEHLLQYKVFLSVHKDLQKTESFIVKDPPAIFTPKSKASLYYITVSLIDNHGYEGPLSETFSLYTSEIGTTYEVQSSLIINSIIIWLILLFMISSFLISHFLFKKIFLRKSPTLVNVSSHYNSRSDSATLSSYDNFADDDVNLCSDDEPLVLA